MKTHNVSINLIKSEKWRQFLESTAAALQMNLVFFAVGAEEHFSACCKCPICGSELQPFNACAAAENAGLTGGTDTRALEFEVFRLDEKYLIEAQKYPCCHEGGSIEFREKVSIAKALLNNFYGILIDQLYKGQLAIELTTLHQINRIVLSMFRGDNNALERVIDLILSAAIILFDAGGSWLDYTFDEQQHILTKGYCVPSSDHAALNMRKAITVEIYSPVIHGTLGIISPVDLERAKDFLDFMVHECTIIFEIDKLLKLMESKLSMILDAVDDMVLLIDRRKNICFANKAALKLFNRSLHEIVTLSVSEINAPWCRCISSETVRVTKGIKDLLVCSAGEIYVDWEVYPTSGSADIPGWFIIARDCTDYYRLQEMGEKVERLVHSSTMLNVIAHEIRNPLATFKGILQIIELKGASPEISKYVNIGLNEIKKLSLLLDDYNQLGKTAAISLEETDLKFFVDEISMIVKAGFNGPDIEIVTSVTNVKPVLADKRQMTQAIFNLVKNAFEALNHKGKISLNLNQFSKDWVEIKVSDNGPGISDDIKDNLFKPYFSTKADGTGLGLAITSSIISNHNGKISCYNLPDGGACFSILLPTFSKVKNQKFDGIHVLIVTNDNLIRYPSERLFKSENIDYYSIIKHESVFSIIDKCRPRVIFIDDCYLNVNILNKLLGNIISDYPDINILIAGDRINKTNEHVFYIQKPVNYAKLVDTIKSILI